MYLCDFEAGFHSNTAAHHHFLPFSFVSNKVNHSQHTVVTVFSQYHQAETLQKHYNSHSKPLSAVTSHFRLLVASVVFLMLIHNYTQHNNIVRDLYCAL